MSQVLLNEEQLKIIFLINSLLYYEHKNYQKRVISNEIEILGELTTL